MIKVIIADDQRILRDGLKTILEMNPDISVTAMASNGREVLELCAAGPPDLILMDIRMPVMDGVETTKKVKELYPQVSVLVLTTFDDEDYILGALSNGACGYLLKDIDGEKLIQAVLDAVSGNFILPGNIAAKLASRITAGNQPQGSTPKNIAGQENFTEREQEIIQYLLKGFSNREMANELYLTEGTVKNYISTIYSKIGVKDRTQAILYFQKR